MHNNIEHFYYQSTSDLQQCGPCTQYTLKYQCHKVDGKLQALLQDLKLPGHHGSVLWNYYFVIYYLSYHFKFYHVIIDLRCHRKNIKKRYSKWNWLTLVLKYFHFFQLAHVWLSVVLEY